MRMVGLGLGFRVWGLGFRVQGSGFRVYPEMEVKGVSGPSDWAMPIAIAVLPAAGRGEVRVEGERSRERD